VYEGLLTLIPNGCDDRGVEADIFSVWVSCSNSKNLHLDSRNVSISVVDGMSMREAVMSSHSRCVSGSNVANIK